MAHPLFLFQEYTWPQASILHAARSILDTIYTFAAVVIVVPWQSRHKLLRQPGHYGVGLGRTRNRQLRSVADGWVGESPTFFWRLGMCNGTHNRDSPFGTFEIQLLGIPRQRVSCGPPMAVPLSLAESQPIPLETPWRSWYPPW